MKIVNKKLSDLRPYEKNPRKIDAAVGPVAESLKRYGFKQPIVIDKNNEIIAGHVRYLASLQLGLEVVPCTIASDLTDEQVKEYRLLDNKLNELAKWDYPTLRMELEGVDLGLDVFKGAWSQDELDVLMQCSFEPEASSEKDPHDGLTKGEMVNIKIPKDDYETTFAPALKLLTPKEKLSDGDAVLFFVDYWTGQQK